MHIKIIIDVDNDAFQDGRMETEVSDILDGIKERLHSDPMAAQYPLQDINGNTIGFFKRIYGDWTHG